MLAFLVAVVYVCMAGTDVITRAVTGTLLGMVTLVTFAVLYADWDNMLPPIPTPWGHNSTQLLMRGSAVMKTIDRLLQWFRCYCRVPHSNCKQGASPPSTMKEV